MPGRERIRVTHPTGGPLITKQAEASEADINNIMARWIAHGSLPLTGKKPTYGDFTNVEGFHSAMQKMKEAEADFMALPASVRKAAENDVGKFLEMVHDPEKRAELEDLGLDPARAPESAPEPVPAAVEEPTPAE